MSEVGITVPGGMSVAIAMPAYGPIPAETARSLFATAQACERVGVICHLIITSGLVELARDLALSEFLAGPCRKLFWIDADMVWEPSSFLRLLAMSTKVDVVCAAYQQKVEGLPQYVINFEPGRPANEYGLIPIKGAGLGFAVVDRVACQRISDWAPEIVDGLNGRTQRAVFRVDVVDGRRRTEDMAFFADLEEHGFQTWLDPMISLGHIGKREWRGRLVDTFAPA